MSNRPQSNINFKLLRFRLSVVVTVIISLILFGLAYKTYAFISIISIVSILIGAFMIDRIYLRKGHRIKLLEKLESVNHAISRSNSVNELLLNVLSTLQDILQTDRAWLLYPCNPNSANWKIPMEVTKPEYPGAMKVNEGIPMTPEAAELFRHALTEKKAIYFDYDSPNSPKETIKKFGVLTQIHIALFPKTGEPWLLGVHQCAYKKVWSEEEIQLFTEVSRRISDALTSLLYLQELSENEQLNRTILNSTAEAILGIDLAGQCTFCNPACVRMLGYSTSTDIIGKSIHALIHPNNCGCNSSENSICSIIHAIENHIPCHLPSVRLVKKDGTTLPAEYWSHPIAEEDSRSGSVVTFIDITSRQEKEAELNFQASHDSLTGLYNRLEFEKRLQLTLQSPTPFNVQHAMLFLDLDQFKVINDTCGHAAGDELLRQLGDILKGGLSPKDTMARIGGDEFAVLLTDCTKQSAIDTANTLLAAVNDFQFVWQGNIFQLQVSIGLVPFSPRDQTISELFKQADAACYLAKDAGRNRVHIHHTNDSEMAVRHGEMQWITRIYSALEENRFTIYAQPIASLRKQTKHHFELLVRMKDANSNIIAPGEFLPAAERFDVIDKIDTWVIKNSFKLLSESPEFLDSINFVSINLSGKSLTSDTLIQTIFQCVESSPVPAHKICFEITETAAIANFNRALNFINELKSKGFLFALDDFGTGLSSFAYLKKIPVDFLKIDGIFVKHINDNPIDFEFVKSINGIGHVMGMKTIAEFVENDSIMNKMSEIGVDYVQGYAIGKPIPLELLIESATLNAQA